MITHLTMRSIIAGIFSFACLALAAQPTSYDEIEFESEETTSAYRPTSRNYAFIRSKRGNTGVTKTSKADSILTFPVTEIVLVFSELTSSAIDNREEANRERWENLMMTYPELFQFSTTYKNICQCNTNGDTAAFKRAQGFYVYFTGEEAPVTKKAEKMPEPPPPPPKQPEPIAQTKKTEEKKSEEKQPEVKQPESGKKEKAKETIAEKTETKPQEVAKTEAPPPPPSEPVDEPVAPAEPIREAPKKKPGTAAKPKKAKDPKACRVACYETGDEDLHAFFKQNITLTKKQRRKGKHLLSIVKLQLNPDGSIKKAMVTGDNENFNQQVQTAVNGMGSWNSSVKNGVAVRSEVKITLKYDRESKAIKPFEIAVTPRLGPKCKCASDAEIFGY